MHERQIITINDPVARASVCLSVYHADYCLIHSPDGAISMRPLLHYMYHRHLLQFLRGQTDRQTDRQTLLEQYQLHMRFWGRIECTICGLLQLVIPASVSLSGCASTAERVLLYVGADQTNSLVDDSHAISPRIRSGLRQITLVTCYT